MEHKCKNADPKPIEKCALNRDQIIKALELHANAEKSCVDECPYGNMRRCGSAMAKDALALINESAEENERLQKALNTDISIVRVSRGCGKTAYLREVARVRMDAVRADTVRKMQEMLHERKVSYGNITFRVVPIDDIDQIAKEMVEGIE